MTTSQIKIINQYGLTYEAEINGIVYYTSQKEDGYYFVDSLGQNGIFDTKENFMDGLTCVNCYAFQQLNYRNRAIQ